MPQDQAIRDLVARMKLIPIHDLIQGQRLLFCEDSIVRGTQLKDTIQRLFDCGAARSTCGRPARRSLYGCKFLNFSRSRSELDLAGAEGHPRARRATIPRTSQEYATTGLRKIRGHGGADPPAAQPDHA